MGNPLASLPKLNRKQNGRFDVDDKGNYNIWCELIHLEVLHSSWYIPVLVENISIPAHFLMVLGSIFKTSL